MTDATEAVWMAEITDVTGTTVYAPCASRADAVAWLSEDAGVDLESVPEHAGREPQGRCLALGCRCTAHGRDGVV